MCKCLASLCIGLACLLAGADSAEAQYIRYRPPVGYNNWPGGAPPWIRGGPYVPPAWRAPVGWNNYYGGAPPQNRGGYYVPPAWRAPVGWNNVWGGARLEHRFSSKNHPGGAHPTHLWSPKNHPGGIHPDHDPSRPRKGHWRQTGSNFESGKINVYR